MKEKIKIVIVNPHLKVGGIASSLSNWASYLRKNKNFEIDYVIFDKEIDSKYSSFIEKYNVMYPRGLHFLVPKVSKFNFKYFVCKVIYKLGFLSFFKTKFTLNYKLDKNYDLAISYSNDIPKLNNNLMANDFVENSVTAKYKVAWIHNDIEKLGIKREYALKRYKKFDAIVNVSDDCKKQFDKIVPEFIHKSLVVGNAIDLEELNEKANEDLDIVLDNSVFNFVTVARIHNEQKRIDRIINVVEKLKSDNLKFHWYIVGDGPDLVWLKKNVKDKSLQGYITFLGFKNNPYPYMKNADYVVLASDYEAQPVTIIEALHLKTPIISTNFGFAEEILLNTNYGFLVNKEVEDLYLTLSKIIKDEKKIRIESFYYNKFTNEFNNMLDFLKIND